MRVLTIIIVSAFLSLNALAQESIKNTGSSYITETDFLNVLLEKNYEKISDISFFNNSIMYHWALKSDKQKCNLCRDAFAEIRPNWESSNFAPSQIIMRYIIRPSTNKITLTYTYNIIDGFTDNNLIVKLIEISSGREFIIDSHKNMENKNIEKNITVVPGRKYYVDIIAKYASEKSPTIFQFDNLKITEFISTGTIVFNTHSS